MDKRIKEQRFEKFVEWDLSDEVKVFYILMIPLIIGLILALFDKEAIMALLICYGSFFLISNIIILKSRKVYWRKIQC